MKKLCCVIVALLVVLLTTFSAVSQEDPLLPSTEGWEERRAQNLARSEIRRAVTLEFVMPFWTMTADQFTIGYFFAPDSVVAPTGFFAPERLQTLMPTLVLVTSMDALESDYDAVLIHESALEWLDPLWVQERYASGYTIRTVGMTFQEHQALTGDYCLTPRRGDPSRRNPMAGALPSGSTMITTYFELDIWKPHTPEDRALALEYGLRQCRENRMPMGYSAGYSLTDVLTEEDADNIALYLVAAAQGHAIDLQKHVLEALIEERLREAGAWE